MKFMMMMHARSGDYQMSAWTPDDIKAMMTFMHTYNKALTESGELVAAEGLAPPSEVRIVHAGDNGLPVISDGPFPESKEFLAGYWIIDVENPERAYELAAKASSSPGPGGKPLNMPIEVRQVGSAPPDTDG